MKININKVKVTPKKHSDSFQLCVFGKPSEEVISWAKFHNLTLQENGGFTNILLNESTNIQELFEDTNQFNWMDGFSPNLNKNLHIGHFSNLVLGKAFKSLGICKQTVSIYGDTLEGEISKEEALNNLKEIQNLYQFIPDKEFMASQMKCEFPLEDGEDSYKGTKVFNIDDEKIVGIKSTGATTYFYQDVSLAEYLNSSTLYLTGKEQSNHFNTLKKLFTYIDHIGLGLVTLSGTKMSSRLGNVIFLNDFIKK
jgi:arginyl-tRNA synthetase